MRRYVQGLVLALMVAWGAVGAAQTSSEWVGKMKGASDTDATAQYSHVELTGTGSRLTGTWGKFTLAGSIEDGHVEISLTDASGALVGQLRGRVGDDSFYGNGSMAPVRGPGATEPAGEWNRVSWTLTRAAKAPGVSRTGGFEPVSNFGVYLGAEPAGALRGYAPPR